MTPRASLSAAFLLVACGGPAELPDRTRAQPSTEGTTTVVTDSATPSDTGDLDPFTGPLLLSETGLYADLDARVLADDLLAYEVAWPLWSDGSHKTRYLRLPPGAVIDTRDIDDWVFPAGTTAFKEFRVDGALVETRMLRKEPDGTWTMVSYAWRDDGSDADAVPDGVSDAGGTRHDIPSRAQCVECHRGPSDTLAGVDAIQLSSGTDTLARWVDAGLLSHPPDLPVDVPGEGHVRDALGYLHGNCGHCHVDGAPLANSIGGSTMRLDVRVGLTGPDQANAMRTAVGLVAKHDLLGTTVVVSPGDHARSQLWARMGARGELGMPPVGTEEVDASGREAVALWIDGLSGP